MHDSAEELVGVLEAAEKYTDLHDLLFIYLSIYFVSVFATPLLFCLLSQRHGKHDEKSASGRTTLSLHETVLILQSAQTHRRHNVDLFCSGHAKIKCSRAVLPPRPPTPQAPVLSCSCSD